MTDDVAEQAAKLLNVALHRAQGEVIAAVWQAVAMLRGGSGEANALLDAIRQHVVGDGQRVAIVADAVSALACNQRQEERVGGMLAEVLAKACQLVDKAELKALELLVPGLWKLSPGAEVSAEAEALLRDLQTVGAPRLVTRPGCLARRFTAWELTALVERTLGPK